MGVTTTARVRGGLAKTVKVCDRCGRESAVLAGINGRMLCDECEAALALRKSAVHAHELEAKAAQEDELRTVRAARAAPS
mgnify:CR=1 FL=1